MFKERTMFFVLGNQEKDNNNTVITISGNMSVQDDYNTPDVISASSCYT